MIGAWVHLSDLDSSSDSFLSVGNSLGSLANPISKAQNTGMPKKYEIPIK